MPTAATPLLDDVAVVLDHDDSAPTWKHADGVLWPSALGYGALDGIDLFGLGILEGVDRIASNIVLPIGGLLIAVFVGRAWSRSDALQTAGMQDGWIAHTWFFLLRYLSPLLILLMLLGLATE